MATPEQKQPTAEDMAKVQAVGTAGATAATAAESPEQAKTDAKAAMREEADRQGLKMSDEDIEQIANLFVDKTVAAFEQLGARVTGVPAQDVLECRDAQCVVA